MNYKRKYIGRRKYEDGGTTKITSSTGSGYSNDTMNNISMYGNMAASVGTDVFNTDAIAKTNKDKYVYGQVQDAGPGGTYEDLSYSITDSMPIASLAHSAGASINDMLAPKNEQGYSDSSNAAIAIGGAIDPGATTDQAMQSLEEGNTWQGIGELLMPGYAAVNQNEEAKKTAATATKQYNAQQQFNKDFNYANTKQANTSLYGNTYQLRRGGKMSMADGGNIQKEFAGPTINSPINAVSYNGPTHEQGGIPIGKNTEVEGNEFRYNDFVFSHALKVKK